MILYMAQYNMGSPNHDSTVTKLIIKVKTVATLSVLVEIKLLKLQNIHLKSINIIFKISFWLKTNFSMRQKSNRALRGML